jgi:hypothetical protein
MTNKNFRYIITEEGDLFIIHMCEGGDRAFGYLIYHGELCGEVFAESSDEFTLSMSIQYLNASDSDEALKCGHRIKQFIDEVTPCQRSVITTSAKLFRHIGGLAFGGRLAVAILKPVSVAQ